MADHSRADIGDGLTRFIQDGAAKEFDWIACNCGFWVCDWIKLRRGVDPVAEFRGFKTAAGFQRLVAKAGGNDAFSRAVAKRAGLTETTEPERGDVGLISTEQGPTMAICVGGFQWAGKSPEGVAIGRFNHLIAWKV